MRVIESEIDEQVVSSGWTTAIAILMIVLGIIALAQPAAGIAFPFLCQRCFNLTIWLDIHLCWNYSNCLCLSIKRCRSSYWEADSRFVVFPIWNFRGSKSAWRGACLDISLGYYHLYARYNSSGVGVRGASRREASPYGESHFKCAGFHLTGD